jgi:hypothetical protein
MKKIILTSVMILSVVIMSSFSVVDSKKKMIGAWEYSVPDAPYEYQEGELIIEKKDGKLTGYTMVDGFKTDIEDVVAKKNNVTFYLYVESEKVWFDLDFEKNYFAGIVSYSEGELEISGKKKIIGS